jgi:hypothetical protein
VTLAPIPEQPGRIEEVAMQINVRSEEAHGPRLMAQTLPGVPTDTVDVRERPGDGYRRVFLRVHGTVLLAVSGASAVVATVGWRTGDGPWAVMKGQGFAYVGFYQAYLLMFVIGLALLAGSTRPRPRVWDLVGLLAHVPPLTINLLARDDVVASAGGRMAAVSIGLHSTFIVLEAVALAWRPSWWRPASHRSGAR